MGVCIDCGFFRRIFINRPNEQWNMRTRFPFQERTECARHECPCSPNRSSDVFCILFFDTCNRRELFQLMSSVKFVNIANDASQKYTSIHDRNWEDGNIIRLHRTWGLNRRTPILFKLWAFWAEFFDKNGIKSSGSNIFFSTICSVERSGTEFKFGGPC